MLCNEHQHCNVDVYKCRFVLGHAAIDPRDDALGDEGSKGTREPLLAGIRGSLIKSPAGNAPP